MNSMFGLTEKEMKKIDLQVSERMEWAVTDYPAFYSEIGVCEFTGVKEFYANVLRYRRNKFNKKADSRNWKMLRQAIYADFYLTKRLDEVRFNTYRDL